MMPFWKLSSLWETPSRESRGGKVCLAKLNPSCFVLGCTFCIPPHANTQPSSAPSIPIFPGSRGISHHLLTSNGNEHHRQSSRILQRMLEITSLKQKVQLKIYATNYNAKASL